MNTPGAHLRMRYGRRAIAPLSEPDCGLCERFVAALPVRSIREWLRTFKGARWLMGHPAQPEGSPQG